MKATINIPDDLYRRVKAEAALRGLTIREVTTDLYRRWLGEAPEEGRATSPAEWLQGWLGAADAAMERAPTAPSARKDLEAARNRLEPGWKGP
jgi:hypothetical protein